MRPVLSIMAGDIIEYSVKLNIYRMYMSPLPCVSFSLFLLQLTIRPTRKLNFS